MAGSNAPIAVKKAEDAKNRIERLAILVADAIQDKAQRLVDALDEPPIDTLPGDPELVREMFNFSPEPNPAAAFWALHDAIMQAGLASGLAPEDAAQAAEKAALERVFPYRLNLCLVGTTTLENQVKRAEQIRRNVERAAPRG